MTMRAIRVTDHGGSEVLDVASVERPTPREGEVRIDVRAAGVNFADIEKRRGNYPDGPTPPYVPGLEAAGTVDAVGPDVDRSVGDRVVALTARGGYAERTTAPADALFPVPDGLSWREAAGVPVQFLTAHNALHEWGGLREGERVLIHAAAGGVGSAAVQLADVAGATVFATASTDEKLRLAAGLGADHTIDYTTADVAAEISALTDGDGVDLVLDGVGGEAFAASLDCLAAGGRIVSYGMASGSIPTVATPRLFFENQSVVGYHLEHALERAPERVRAAVPTLVDRLAAGEVRVEVGRAFPLAEAAAAHEFIERRASTGKVVLEP